MENSSMEEWKGDGRMGKEFKIAVAHWKIKSWGGAEYLATKLAETLNINKIYTIAPIPEKNPYGDVELYDVLSDFRFSASKRLQIKLFDRVFEYSIWEDVDWNIYDNFDIIITSGSTTRAIITPDDVLHVNYCHSPPRWLYDLYHRRIKSVKVSCIHSTLLRYLRMRDLSVDSRVDYYLVNSPIIRRRLWKYYKRDSEILYPPIDTSKYRYRDPEDYYLYLGRLDREKGIIEIIKAFKNLGLRLKIAGGRGDAFREVMKLMKSCRNVEYVGFVSEKEKIDLLSRCKAVIYNAVNEDFGIVPIEANASGKLCISIAEGFPGIYIKDEINGFLHNGSVEGIKKAVINVEKIMDENKVDPYTIKKSVISFDINTFRENLLRYLNYFYNNLNKLTTLY